MRSGVGASFFCLKHSPPALLLLHGLRGCSVLLSFAARAMAPSKKSSTAAEVALVPLKTCLVNLPTSVVSLLVNANAVGLSREEPNAQN